LPGRTDLTAHVPRKAIEELRSELGGEVPKGLSRLADDELGELTEAIRAARHRQSQALAQAGERALGHIPRLLRVPIRRVLG
jgi:hypothetical protein